MAPSARSPAPSSGPQPSSSSPSSSRALPRPPPVLYVPSPPPPPRPGKGYTPPSQLPPGAVLPPPPRPGPVVRPPPARQGQPASARDFGRSSAGGASSHLGYGAGAGRKKDGEEGARGLSAQQARKRERWGESYVAAEETIRNDYSGQYVQTGARPQNHLRNTAVEARFNEYPKLATLLAHKHALTASPRHSIPPTYLNLPSPPPASSSSAPEAPHSPSPSSPMSAALATLSPARFDAILLTPPPSVSYAELAALDLGSRAATPGFVWLWVGSGQAGLGAEGAEGGIGLEKGRELLTSWGYRRCEDIVWLKTNRRDPEGDLVKEPVSLFNPTIEHCLMGIRGTVRRSTDAFLVHCNVDTDVIVWEGDEEDLDLKPPELQTLIENFCLGTRRLHLYGSPHALRRGWLTVASAPGETFSAAGDVRPVEGEGDEREQRERWGAPREWSRDEWEARWKRPGAAGGADGALAEVEKVESLLPFIEELDALRPKSPPPRNGLPSSGGLGRGRGAGLGITRSGLVPHGAVAPSSVPSAPNGLGRGRGRGGARRDGPGPALLPAAPQQLGMPYAGAMHPPPPHPSASAPPFLGAPSPFPGSYPHRQQFQQQQAFYPPGSYSPYAPPAHHPGWAYAPPHQPFGAPYPPPPSAPYTPHVFPPPSAAPPPHPAADPHAMAAHLAHLQAQQAQLEAHLQSLQLAAPAPVHPLPQGEGGLVYPIGGPRGEWEDARE
ncbi:regulatory protein [Rhodotorula kratochvilovae]